MKSKLILFLSGLIFTIILSSPLTAAIIVDPNGVGATDVSPANPATWTSNINAYIGKMGDGTLLINDGSEVISGQTYLGYYGFDSTGIVTVDGAGSTFKSAFLKLGNFGDGILQITNGGLVQVSGSTFASGIGSSSLSKIQFNNGTLDTGSLFFNQADLRGTGEIYTHGIVGDIDLRFDANLGPQQTIQLNSTPGQNITLHLDLGPSNFLGAGYKGSGSVQILEGRTITTSGTSYIAYDSYSTSTSIITVDGTGSTWINHGSLYIGQAGHGKLEISNGGLVEILGSVYINPFNLNSTSGKIELNGGTLVTGNLCFNPADLTGNGEIYTDGMVCDLDLRFDATSGINQPIHFTGPGKNISLYLSDDIMVLGIGYRDSGSMQILEGQTIASIYGYIGYAYNSTGTVTVDGIGSTWTNRFDLKVGHEGDGTLQITNGAMVSNKNGYIGSYSGLTTNTVTVDGIGSTWINLSSLYVGEALSNSILQITNEGLVTVGGTLNIKHKGSINMTTGGMLALAGEADDSLTDFLDLVQGTDAIRWWNPSLGDWDLLTSATFGTDYTLEYLTEGDLTGYTLLTVGTVPEPGCVAMIIAGLLALGLFPAFRRKQ